MQAPAPPQAPIPPRALAPPHIPVHLGHPPILIQPNELRDNDDFNPDALILMLQHMVQGIRMGHRPNQAEGLESNESVTAMLNKSKRNYVQTDMDESPAC